MLSEPFVLRGVSFRNRAWTSPMCQYSADGGLPNDWHLVHLGSRAVGGAGLVMAEATAVSPEGRISPGDTGLWSERHAEAFAPIIDFVGRQGAVAGIQLGHAGRKASAERPWDGGGPLRAEAAWETVGPSEVPFGDFPAPRTMSDADLEKVELDFVRSARLAVECGFEVVELHMAHGYLLHSFLSPLANRRSDALGGDLAGRSRFPLQVARAVREVLPDRMPLFVRLSCTDWADERGGFNLEEAVEVSAMLRQQGADLVDCSSGGMIPDAEIPVGPGYQVPLAHRVREGAEVPTAAVGMLHDPATAEAALASGAADAVFVARGMLADPYWARHALKRLGDKVEGPVQYGRAQGVLLD